MRSTSPSHHVEVTTLREGSLYLIYLFFYLAMYLSTYLYMYPSIYIYPSNHPSVSLCVCLSVSLSIYLCIYLTIFLFLRSQQWSGTEPLQSSWYPQNQFLKRPFCLYRMSAVCNKYREVSDISFLLVHFFPCRSHRVTDCAGELVGPFREGCAVN
jgi:hypothetical protein